MAVASAGNLSISQSVLSMLREGWENPDTGETETLVNAPTMFQAAQRVGRTIRQIHQVEGVALETSDVKFDVAGRLAYANSGPNTNGSQFFIMHVDYPLPPSYTIFGRVTEGQDVVNAIATSQADRNDKPINEVKMEKVTIE